jgi:hypothetical protein
LWAVEPHRLHFSAEKPRNVQKVPYSAAILCYAWITGVVAPVVWRGMAAGKHIVGILTAGAAPEAVKIPSLVKAHVHPHLSPENLWIRSPAWASAR